MAKKKKAEKPIESDSDLMVVDEVAIEMSGEMAAAEVLEGAAEAVSDLGDEVIPALADAGAEVVADDELEAEDLDFAGTELEGHESADIEDIEKLEAEQVDSIVESLLFASDKPLSMALLKASFRGTNVKTEDLRQSLKRLALDLEGGRRGVRLEEVAGGYQIRTKPDNLKFLTRSVKPRVFRLSGPALEVLSICAYKQPVVKSEIDEIRGVDSGHLIRALMEKGLVNFGGKSDLPGKPMFYETTRKFLEIFGLRNLKELPTLSQIDELLPEGIGDDSEDQKGGLSDLTGELSKPLGEAYSEGEEELLAISEKLIGISTTTEFFEDEKAREKRQRDEEKARNLRELLANPETEAQVSKRDRNWLERFDAALAGGATEAVAGASANKGSRDGAFANEGSREGAFDDAESEAEPLDEGRFTEDAVIAVDLELATAEHDEEPSDAESETEGSL